MLIRKAHVKNVFLLLVTVASLSCKKNVSNDSKVYATDNPKVSNIDKLVEETFSSYASQKQTAGFSIAVINGSEINEYNYGETNLGNKTLPNRTTLYEIGSITKTFTAASLMFWTIQNNIDINDPIKKYLPAELAPKLSLNGAEVTLKHILMHSSGLPRIPNNLGNALDPYNGYDSVKVFNYIASNNLLRTPGSSPTKVEELNVYYSNLAYALAGIILERQLKAPLQTIFDNYIFSAHGMTGTTLQSIENTSNRAFPTNATNNASYWNMSGMSGAGGLKSNLADMIKYVQAQLKLDASMPVTKSYSICQTPMVKINQKDIFGYGWEFYYTPGQKRLIVKDGGTGGFTSFIAFDVDSKKAVITLFNNSSDNNCAVPFANFIDTFFK